MRHSMIAVYALLLFANAAFRCTGENWARAGEQAKQEAPASADWPQWRGPNRDGTAPGCPKLLDTWPKEGPKLLWESAPIPSAEEGGCGSPVVAGGKVFVLLASQIPIGKYVVTPEFLKKSGWVEGVPDELAAKIEEARAKKGALQGEKLDAYIKDFTATLDPSLATKFADHIKFRLTQKPKKYNGYVHTWAQLVKLASIQGKGFTQCGEEHPTADDLGAAMGLNYAGFREIYEKNHDYSKADIVVCLDAGTGKEVWRKALPAVPTAAPVFCATSSTPAIVGDKCYALGSTALFCLSVKDGSILWQSKFDDYDEESGRRPYHNTSPLVVNGAVYVQTEDGLKAYNANSGDIIWCQPRMKNSSSSVAKWTHDGKDYIIGTDESGMSCIEPSKAAVLWTIQLSGWFGNSTPVIQGDTALTLGGAFTCAYKLAPQKVEAMWKPAPYNDANRGLSPVIYENHVYIIGGSYQPYDAVCLDLRTGETKWKAPRTDHPGMWACSSSIIADGKIITAMGGGLWLFKATPEKYTVLASVPKPCVTGPSPALVDGKLFVRQKDSIACYDLKQ